MEVSLIQGLSNTVKYYRRTRTSVLNREVSFTQIVLYREVPLYTFMMGLQLRVSWVLEVFKLVKYSNFSYSFVTLRLHTCTQQ